jgi:hypothetical protein
MNIGGRVWEAESWIAIGAQPRATLTPHFPHPAPDQA